MYNFLLIIQDISIILIIVSIFYIMRQTPSPIQRDLLLLQIALLITIMSGTLEMKATDIGGAIVATKMGYVGRPITAFAMFFLIIDFTRMQIKHIFRTICAAIQVVYILVVFTFEKHGLFYKSVSFVDGGLFPHLVKERGPLYYVFNGIAVLFCLGMIAICVIQSRKNNSKGEKNLLALFGLIILLPVIGYILYYTNITRGYNLSTFGYAIGSYILTIIFRKYDVFGKVNIAWEKVFNHIGAGLIVYDGYGKLIYQNEKAKEMDITYRVNELYKSREYIFRDNQVYRVEKLKIQDDNEEMGYAYYIDNETDNYNYEMRLKEEKQRADDANAAKTLFLSSMSHDIRTPMNAILGLTDIASMHIDENRRVKDCLQKIKTSGKHLIELINEVLDINKIESGKFELMENDFDLIALTEEIGLMCKPLVDAKSHTLSIDTSGVKSSWINADRSRLSQILMNLISNAIKYTNNGGLITVKILETSEGVDTSVYKIIIRDNGIGMSEDYLPTLFEPFTRAKDEKVYKNQGTGLGMTITKQFVDLMGGTIEVKSTLGIGTTFIIVVPIKHGDQAAKSKHDKTITDLANADFSGKKVLVVEDNEVNAEIMGEFLKMAGIDAEFAKDGIEALEVFDKQGDDYFDLILMDGEMPRMNGYEATAKIRLKDTSYAVRVPIIAVTANAFAEDVARAINAGMNSYIIKPIEYNKLYEVLATYCV